MKHFLLFLLFIFNVNVFGQTNCLSLPLPFSENFETTSPTLSCWNALNVNGDGQQWITNTNNAYSGSQCKALLLQNASQYGTANDWLTSPEINLGNDGVVKQLKFYVKLSPLQHVGWRVAQKLQVNVATNAGQTAADFTLNVHPNKYYSNEYYQMVLVDLVNAQGAAIQGNVRIGFHVLETVNPIGRGMYIDEVSVAAKPTCPQPTNLGVCADSTTASGFWQGSGGITSFEYSVVLAGQEPNFPGLVHQSTAVELTNLLPNTDYVLYVRSNCSGNYSNYVPFYFKTIPSVVNANPFCGESGSLVFENSYGQPNTSGYGPIGCLSFSPNPVWYYFEVSQPGNLEFNIIQNTLFDANGTAIGQNLDVDYVAFGPFTSLADACSSIDIEYCIDCPSYQQVNNPGSVPANAYPNGNIVDCSPSPSYIEELSIPNAQAGQIYAVLISNWDGLQGFIKLEQTNINQPGAGSTNCEFLCSVNLGEDVVLCNATSYTISANIITQGSGDIISIAWFKDNVLLDPTIYNTLTINVTEDGVYRVQIEKEQCEEDIIEDEIWVRFVNSFPLNSIPNNFSICDIYNDNIEQVNFNVFENTFITQNYTATYHMSENDANLGVNAINRNSYSITENTSLYIRVSHVLNANCYVVKPIVFELDAMFVPNVAFSYPSEICLNDINNILPQVTTQFTTGGTFSSASGLGINSRTGEIDLTNSLAGTYVIKYHIPMDVSNCSAEGSYEFTVKLYPKFSFSIQPACVSSDFSLTLKNLLGITISDVVSYSWSGPGNFNSTNPEIIIKDEGTYTLQITTKDGCILSESIVIDNTRCFIQRGISPNGDGYNESFVIENYLVAQVKIMNRYGNEVYSFNGAYKDQWHGQDKSGNQLPSGTYFYEIVTHKGPITGWIEINR